MTRHPSIFERNRNLLSHLPLSLIPSACSSTSSSLQLKEKFPDANEVRILLQIFEIPRQQLTQEINSHLHAGKFGGRKGAMICGQKAWLLCFRLLTQARRTSTRPGRSSFFEDEFAVVVEQVVGDFVFVVDTQEDTVVRSSRLLQTRRGHIPKTKTLYISFKMVSEIQVMAQ